MMTIAQIQAIITAGGGEKYLYSLRSYDERIVYGNSPDMDNTQVKKFLTETIGGKVFIKVHTLFNHAAGAQFRAIRYIDPDHICEVTMYTKPTY